MPPKRARKAGRINRTWGQHRPKPTHASTKSWARSTTLGKTTHHLPLVTSRWPKFGSRRPGNPPGWIRNDKITVGRVHRTLKWSLRNGSVAGGQRDVVCDLPQCCLHLCRAVFYFLLWPFFACTFFVVPFCTCFFCTCLSDLFSSVVPFSSVRYILTVEIICLPNTWTNIARVDVL